ncbi:hypothetical protein [Effusibacillus consociatus]|uniref:DUF2712 domain-containing protein n=1 Tax=Effusibacillus consociatus TaxID=1117041 RepID=A0ABV9Q7I7_9BACL
MKRKVKALAVVGLASGILSTSALAYNYKFQFDVTTGWFSDTAYTAYAYKVTDTENPVVNVTAMDLNWTANIMMVNSNDLQRSSIGSWSSPGAQVLTNMGGKQGYQYRLKIWEAYPNSKTYSIKGAWNPDSY